MIGLNLTGVYYCCHEILPIFRQAGGGDVINISSLAGKNAFAGGAGYNASKFGLNGFSEAMMLDHRNDGCEGVDNHARQCRHRVRSLRPRNARGKNDQNAWKIAPEDIAEIVVDVLRMPRRTTVSRVEVGRHARPGKA